MKNRLRPLAEKPSDSEKPEKPHADLHMIQEYFSILEQAMQRMDIDTADEIIRHFETFQYPEPVLALMEQLDLSVTNLDAEQTKTVIRTLEKTISEMTSGSGNGDNH